ncbi:GvpL/GvpF family gas vesicle protein [Actinomadura rugatobispora]|uniref:GvpL/GvpF family gas vesicle protein n=1 Tax=Actinomadura rugatobispora TaxID=1994 RepID=A0ABW1AEW1_9ACTN|nr:GvpL/GvpF family gas vesicle protein [Actinomadura rugatobispora]
MTAHPEAEAREGRAGGEAVYVYAIVPGDTEVPEGLSGTDGAGLSLVRHGDLAAVVSEVVTGRPFGAREDLLAHERVVETLAGETTVLPLRFGAVVRSADAVTDELVAPHHDWFANVLADFAGRAEFIVVGTYVQDAVLREVLMEDPEAMRLRESVRRKPEDAGYYERVRLGELIVQGLEAKRQADGAALVEAIAPHAVAVTPRRPAGDEAAADVAFLVAEAERERFEQAVDDLGRRWAGRVRLRVIGPLAPYDFVPPITEREAASWGS